MSNEKIINLLKELPEPYRSQAIENYDPNFYLAGEKVKTRSDALGWAFDWDASPEGKEYWQALRRYLEFGDPLPQPMSKLTAEEIYDKFWIKAMEELGYANFSTISLKAMEEYAAQETSALLEENRKLRGEVGERKIWMEVASEQLKGKADQLKSLTEDFNEQEAKAAKLVEKMELLSKYAKDEDDRELAANALKEWREEK